MTTKTKPIPVADAIASFLTIGTGRDVEAHVAQRAALTEGRSVAELDQIAQALVEIDRDGDASTKAHAGWLLIRLAEADHAAAKAASKANEPIPASPFLDAMTRRTSEMTSTKVTTKRSSNASTARKPATDVRYVCNGRVMPDGQNRLSNVAYQYTTDIKKGVRNIPTVELAKMLGTLGVADPNEPGWSVELPNGVTVACFKEGEQPASVDKPKTNSKPKNVTPIAPKQAVKAAKATTQKKAVAAAKKQGAASKPLAKKMAPRKALAAEPNIVKAIDGAAERHVAKEAAAEKARKTAAKKVASKA